MTDERLEAIIANLLRAGVLAAATIVLFSGTFYLIQHHAERVNYATFQLERSNLRTIPGIFFSTLRMRTDAVIQLGLVLLIATPIVRVIIAALGFYLEGDRLYLGVSLIVLAILIFSMIHAV